MKEKVLVLSLSKWEIDGNKGGKVVYSKLDRTETENRSGIDILESPCPWDSYALCPRAPFVAELELGITSANVNGRSIAKIKVLAVHHLEEKKLTSNCLSVSLNA